MEHWISWFHEQTVGAEVKEVALAAESLGFTGVALSDHIAIPKYHTALHPELGKPSSPCGAEGTHWWQQLEILRAG